ncbi:MAG: nucleotidyl transferase AbiEii/AbiGii toxin family protein [Actinomycetota bacterium]|nr:nucleotidyl transferase AbiEii/AbiGii toxin family protein [Actinomycetota bacterium]
MPTPDEFQARVARVALQAAAAHGFALAGGNALAAHGIISRPTHDVDLFTAAPGAVSEASGPVAGALAAAGLSVSAVEASGELGEMFEGFDQEMTEYDVSDGVQAVRLQLVRFDRSRPAVMMDVGPVLHPDDLVGSKVAAMATRAEPRDYADVASALRTYGREHLVELARRADPDLADEELAEAMQALDGPVMGEVLARQFGPEQVRGIREAFAGWPREAEAQAQAESREPDFEAGG